MTPMAGSMALLRKHGFIVERVERWNPFSKTRRDLWGFDLVAIRPSSSQSRESLLLFIQCTTFENRLKRLRKLMEKHEQTTRHLLRALVGLQVHAWKAPGKKRRKWECEVINIVMDADGVHFQMRSGVPLPSLEDST